MLYLLYKIGLSILSLSSRETAYSVVSFFSKLKCVFSKRDRELVKANLRAVLPEADDKKISSLAGDVFKNFGRYLADFFFPTEDREGYLKRAVHISGIENIDEALKSGKGCIVLSGHFGNWELAGCALANRGYKLNAVVLPHADPRINNLFIERRRKAGANVAHIGNAKTAVREALRRNESIAILGDRPYGDRGVKIRFFGRTAVFPRGAALFSLRNGSPIVLAFTPRTNAKDNTYTLILEKPFLPKRNGLLEEQLRGIMQRFADRFEYYIRKYPSQWYMFHNVWSERKQA